MADVDVCVAGGGPAGLGAALAAARAGARVCLLERHAFLGGNFTAASVGTICGLYVNAGSGRFDYVTRGIAQEVADALVARRAATGPMPFKSTAVMLYVPWAAKRLFDHLVDTDSMSQLIAMADDPDARVRIAAFHALACDRCKDDICAPGADDRR